MALLIILGFFAVMLTLPAVIAVFAARFAPNKPDPSRGAIAAIISGFLLAFPILVFWPSDMRFDVFFLLVVYCVVGLALSAISYPVAWYVSKRQRGSLN